MNSELSHDNIPKTLDEISNLKLTMEMDKLTNEYYCNIKNSLDILKQNWIEETLMKSANVRLYFFLHSQINEAKMLMTKRSLPPIHFLHDFFEGQFKDFYEIYANFFNLHNIVYNKMKTCDDNVDQEKILVKNTFEWINSFKGRLGVFMIYFHNSLCEI